MRADTKEAKELAAIKLAQGATQAEAAAVVRRARETVAEWTNDPEFRERYLEERQRIHEAVMADYVRNLMKALDIDAKVLAGQDVKGAQMKRAATYVDKFVEKLPSAGG